MTVVQGSGHGFILFGTQSTKHTPTWYKTYAIVGVVSIPTYKKCDVARFLNFRGTTTTAHQKKLYHV
jgi:hypothetical protein